MPPLTSSSGCKHCLRMSETILDLHKRLAVLSKTWENSVVMMGATTRATAEDDLELDTTIPEAQQSAEGCWLLQGAKLKRPVSSTPADLPWTTVHNWGKKQSPRQLQPVISHLWPDRDAPLHLHHTLIMSSWRQPYSTLHTTGRLPRRPSS